MAGLAAARRLKNHDVDVTIFEKSRGVGGRMATRRVDELRFDHGAQYFTIKDRRFGAMVNEWQAAGHAQEWFEGAFVGTPGMTAPARAMADGLCILNRCEVTRLHRDENGWSLFDETGLVDTPDNGRFAAVILAIPAPQAAPLAAAAGVLLSGLDTVRFAPCWALMLSFSTGVELPDDRISPQDKAISWIARNSSKPDRTRTIDTFVVHATPDWSRRHLELPVEAAARELTDHFRRLSGIDAQPAFSAAHRWRYALVEQTAGSPFLWDRSARLGACGDWCLGPRVEAAFDSGDALGAAVIHALGVDIVA